MKVLIRKTNNIEEVNDSFAINYLIPRGLAMVATEKVLKEKDSKEKAKQEIYEKKQSDLDTVANKIKGKKVVLKVKANEEGELFGSINKQMIKKALEIKEKVAVILPAPIKRVGEYNLDLKIGKKKVGVVLIVKAS